MPHKATAEAKSNIAFIKYWGNRDNRLRIPLNDSVSMNLDHATTRTTVEFDERLEQDEVRIGGKEPGDRAQKRVVAHLDRMRALAKIEAKARVESENSFPQGAGIASSASGFAALTLAAAGAAGLELGERDLSKLARQASGSACRSIPPGFVEWVTGWDPENSYAYSIAPLNHWALRDVIAIVSSKEKQVGSTEGHGAAASSPFLNTRLNALGPRLHRVRRAIRERDLMLLGPAIEEEAIELHFIAMSSRPPIFYWSPEMVRVIQAMQQWRAQGLPVYFTLDAGPNVHLICETGYADEVAGNARALNEVQQVLVNAPGEGARLVDEAMNK